MTDTVADATYLLGLGRLPGVGAKTAIRLAAAFPTPEALLEADPDRLGALVGARTASRLFVAYRALPDAVAAAARVVERHEAQGIAVLALTSARYPPLLRLTPDPPPVLYARGRVAALSSPEAVAVVGTREPTRAGLEIARRISERLAGSGYTVVSGLAKGIDTAGHAGALATGTTVAVLGTSIGEIYPAENAQLAAEIEARGVLVSEYGLGDRTNRQAFVQRDRIQAGLSLAVIAVQTGVKGGTLHTIGFAERAGRLVFCPRPHPSELGHTANAGIIELLRTGRAQVFDGDYARLFHELAGVRDQLASNPGTVTLRAAGQSSPSTDAGLFDWDAAPAPVSRPISRADGDGRHELQPPATGPVLAQDVIRALDDTLARLAPNLDARAFEELVHEWRRHRSADADD